MSQSVGHLEDLSQRDRADITYIGFLLGHGGDALQMLELASGMQRRGALVNILVPAVAESVTFAERAQSLGIPCERTALIRASMMGSQQRLAALIRLLRSVRSPIVHFHTGNSCLPRSLMIALEALRYRRGFVTLQSPYETIVPGSGRARFWAATARRRFIAVVSPSDHGSRFQVRCGVPATTAVTVRNSIDVDRWSSGDGGGPRRQLGVDADDPLIVFSSRIDGQKRPLDAVRIFARVASEFPRARMVFVGDGALRNAVTEESVRLGVADRVDLVGYQTNVEDWVAAATVWILPTERENFSLAVLEALAAGRAVLSTSCPGNDEVLVDGENAAVFGVGDVDAGAARLRALLGDDALRRRIGSRAATAAVQFSSERMVDGYNTLYLRSDAVPNCLPRGKLTRLPPYDAAVVPTAIVMDGKALRDETVCSVRAQIEQAGSPPVCLATVLVGDDGPSRAYVRSKHSQATRAGLQSRNIELPTTVAQREVEAAVAELAADPMVHGILVQLPLPERFDPNPVIDLVPPEKDVDGLTERSMGRLVRGAPGLTPCTPLGVLRLLEHYGVPTDGRRAVVVGRSLLVGLPLALLLARKGVDATVTIAHSRTADLTTVCREAEILVAAAGHAGMITADHVRRGAAVIDIGVSRTNAGVVGDVDQASVAPVAGWITPMPGGTGPMTVASLVSNTLEAARMQGVLK